MADLNRIKQNVAKMATMNAPEADIDGYIASEGVTVDDVRNHQMQPQERGIGERITQDYAGRLKEGQQALDAYDRGEQGAGLTALDYLGKVGFGTAADAGGEVLKSAASFAPQGVKDAVSSGISAISNSPAGDAARYVGDQYKDLAKRYPNATRHVEALANIGGVLTPEIPIKGTSLLDASLGGAQKTGKFLKEAGQDLIRPPSTIPTVMGAAKEAVSSKPYYQVFDEIGGGLPKDQVQAISKSINSIRPQDAAEAAIWDESGAQGAVDLFNKATSQGTLTFRGAQALRADVNSRIKKAYRAGDDTMAANLMKIKDHLTDALTKTDASDISDVKLKNAWKMANHEFSKESLLDELDMIAAKATAPSRAQPANSLATAIDSFLNNPKLSRGLQENERKALQEVSQTTSRSELLKSGATRLLSTAGAAKLGPVGFIIGHYGSEAARDAALSARLRKLDKAYEIIRNRKAPDLTEYKSPLMLSDQRRSTLERNISQRKSYEASKGLSGAPILQDAPPNQLLLQSPDKMQYIPNEYIGGSSGSIKPKTYAEMVAEAINRDQRTSLGLSGDIDRLNMSRSQRAKLEEVLSGAEKSAAEKKKAQEELMFGMNKTNIKGEIDKHQSPDSAMAQALLKARKKKTK